MIVVLQHYVSCVEMQPYNADFWRVMSFKTLYLVIRATEKFTSINLQCGCTTELVRRLRGDSSIPLDVVDIDVAQIMNDASAMTMCCFLLDKLSFVLIFQLQMWFTHYSLIFLFHIPSLSIVIVRTWFISIPNMPLHRQSLVFCKFGGLIKFMRLRHL